MAHARDNHVIMETTRGKHGRGVRITSPSDVLRIHDVDELKAQLEHYSHPMTMHVVPNSTFARKWYVEKVRPALRFFCKKFGVTVPKWLENEDHYRNMDDAQKQEYFGTTRLSFREFTPPRKVTDVSVVRK